MTPQKLDLKDARLSWNGKSLVAETALFTRDWALTPRGLGTTAMARKGGTAWDLALSGSADWHLRGVTDVGDATLEDVSMVVNEKDPRQGDHLEARFKFRHGNPGFDITWILKLWPGAPGTWTALHVKPVNPTDREKDFHLYPSYLGKAWGESLPLSFKGASARAQGLYCDSQHRHFDHTPMLKEEAIPIPAAHRIVAIEWANLLTVQTGAEGLTVVKENHKCVGSDGIDTGAFVLGDPGLMVTGLGIAHYHYGGTPWWAVAEGVTTWATWTLVHPAGVSHGGLAVKVMDRLRYPFQMERDGLVMCNTWGSAGSWTPFFGREGAPASTEEKHLCAEIESAGDLGVDILQVDNGWSYAPGYASPDRHHPSRPWTPDPDRLPHGWEAVKTSAEKAGISLGLWFPYDVPRDCPEKVLANQKAGSFRRFKFDFMNIRTPDDVAKLRQTMSGFLDRAAPHTGINFDLTEADTRVGYFFGREFGNLFFANRENGPGPMNHGSHIAYTPRLALREYWHLAHVVNLNQVQLTVQDKDTIPVGESNAKDYSHGYALAMALMGVPLFFLETKTLSETARREWKELLALYRRHREAMWRGYVFPIGDEPNDRSITGFQSHGVETGSGYLTVFREIGCSATEAEIPLHFLEGKTLQMEDLVTGEKWVAPVATAGLRLPMDTAGGFRWLAYQSESGPEST